MNHKDIHTNSRFAGGVVRYHTWPNIRPQTVAEHTWHCMRIWYHIWGPLPSYISSYILWHDCGELVTGDPPFMMKKTSPSLKEIHDVFEKQAIENMDGPNSDYGDPLTAEEKTKVKICDLIEMFEYGIVELAFGNQFGRPIIAVTYQAIMDLLSEEPEPKMNKKDCLRVSSYIAKLVDVATNTYKLEFALFST